MTLIIKVGEKIPSFVEAEADIIYVVDPEAHTLTCLKHRDRPVKHYVPQEVISAAEVLVQR